VSITLHTGEYVGNRLKELSPAGDYYKIKVDKRCMDLELSMEWISTDIANNVSLHLSVSKLEPQLTTNSMSWSTVLKSPASTYTVPDWTFSYTNTSYNVTEETESINGSATSNVTITYYKMVQNYHRGTSQRTLKIKHTTSGFEKGWYYILVHPEEIGSGVGQAYNLTGRTIPVSTGIATTAGTVSEGEYSWYPVCIENMEASNINSSSINADPQSLFNHLTLPLMKELHVISIASTGESISGSPVDLILSPTPVVPRKQLWNAGEIYRGPLALTIVLTLIPQR